MISYVLFSETAENISRVTRYIPWPSNDSAEEGRLLASDTVNKNIDLHTNIFGWVFLKVTVSLLGFPIFSWVSPRLRFFFVTILCFCLRI